MAEKIDVYADILGKNDRIAAANRKLMGNSFCVNIMSSPGAGKTTLLEKTLKALGGKYLIGVVEGDMATSNDARRLRKFAKPGAVYQVKTENYGGGCHLDAAMVSAALKKIKAPTSHYDVIIVENVGNLICPADFNLGEHKKVVMLSVTEGDDKPLKYPVIFRAADFVLITKTDLLRHTDFNMKKAMANIRRISPKTGILDVSSCSGSNMTAWYDILKTWICKSRSQTCK